jgi:hypothetical protein
MLDNYNQNPNKNIINFSGIAPDPWEGEPESPKFTHPSWQFPLDPNHEIEAAPAPDGVLSPAGDPTMVQIPAHSAQPALSGVEVLLQDELKIDATQAKSLWQHIRDGLALLWWKKTQDE